MNRHLIQYIKDPGSAITHFIALVGAVVFSFPLIGKAVGTSNATAVAAMVIFISSMILLYGASTSYHTFDISKAVNLALRRVDHAMIFVLIAGSYTCIFSASTAAGAQGCLELEVYLHRWFNPPSSYPTLLLTAGHTGSSGQRGTTVGE